MHLNSSDSFRLVTLLEDAVDKLDILAAMAPDITDLEGEVSQLVRYIVTELTSKSKLLAMKLAELLRSSADSKQDTKS